MKREMEQSSAPPKGLFVDEKGWNLDINPYNDLQKNERSLMSIEREKIAKRRSLNSPKNVEKYMDKTAYGNKDLHARSLTKMHDYHFSSDLLQIKPVLPPRRLGLRK